MLISETKCVQIVDASRYLEIVELLKLSKFFNKHFSMVPVIEGSFKPFYYFLLIFFFGNT